VRWELADGTVVTLEGDAITVTGESPVAEDLRVGLNCLRAGRPPAVPVAPPPGGSVDLVPNTYIVDRWVRAHAFSCGRQVAVRGRPRPESEAPAYVRELWDAYRRYRPRHGVVC